MAIRVAKHGRESFHAPVIPAETFRRHRATPSAHAQPCHSRAPLACAAIRIRNALRLGHTGAAPPIHSQSPAPAPSPPAIHALRMTVCRATPASPYRRPASKISANPRRRPSRSSACLQPQDSKMSFPYPLCDTTANVPGSARAAAPASDPAAI